MADRRFSARALASLHSIHALLEAGLLERTEDGRIAFPYDAVHVDFRLEAA